MTTEWIDVSDVTPRIAYTATASQTVFTIPFVFFADTDLLVYQNAVLLTLDTDYTVTGAEDEDGGTLTLLTGATVGDEIMIVREVPIEQTTHIPPSGPLDIPAINIQFSKFVAMIQQIVNLLTRSIHFPDSDSTTSGELAAPADRKNRLLGFGTAGELVYAAGPTFVGDTSTGVAEVDSRGTAEVTTFDVSVTIIRVDGYHTPGDGGGAIYKQGTSGGPNAFQDGGGTWWNIVVEGSPRALQWGLAGDATEAGAGTDDSALAQIFVDDNKGSHIVFDKSRLFKIGGILLDDSTYDNTEIEGRFLLKARINLADTNMQSSVFVGFGIQDCDGVRIDGEFHGNRANQYDVEQTFCVCLAGVTNFKSDILSFKEINGDGIYITTSSITSNSTNSDTLTFGTIVGENTADDGRNLVSLISGDNVTIGTFRSIRIGGTVGGFLMPGGFDAEADNAYHSIKNLVIGAANIVTAGSAGFSLFAQPISGSVRSVNVGAVSVLNTSAATVVDGSGNTTVTNNVCLLVRNCEDVTIASFKGEFKNAYGIGADIGNGINYSIKGTVRHAAIGTTLAVQAGDIYGLTGSSVNIEMHDIARFGFQIGNVSTSFVRGTVIDAKSTFYAARYAVITIGGWTNTELTMSVNVAYDADWTRAYRNDNSTPNTLTECKITDAHFGINWPSYLSMVDMAVLVFNSHGYTDSTLGAPGTGPRLVGQHNRNGLPVVGQAKGWYCTVSGTPGTVVSEGVL